MSLTVESSKAQAFHGAPVGRPGGERSMPLTIRTRPDESSLADGGSAGVSGSGALGGGFPFRRLRRDSEAGSTRRDYRSYSSEWISSPLLEGFASFHSALNSVQEGVSISALSSSAMTSSTHDTISCSFPYLCTCWSEDHSGESSVSSSRSTQATSSMVSTDDSNTTDSLVLDDWDLLKSRSFSIDVASPVPMDNFMPFLFPMDPADANGSPHTQHGGCLVSTSLQACGFFGDAPQHQHQSIGAYVDPTHASMQQQSSYAFADYPDTRAQAVYCHYPYQHQHLMLTAHESSATLIAGSPPSGKIGYGLPGALRRVPQQPTFRVATSQGMKQSPTSSSLLSMMPPRSLMPSLTSPTSLSSSAASSSFLLPLADIQLLTKLNSCYWKNGRKNLQCFPICPEHNDFYSMKMSNRKHTSVGVCRGPVYTHVFLPASPSFPPGAGTVKPQGRSSMGQHMKYEFGVGASGSGGSAYEVFVLGKFERVPQRNDDDDLEELLPPPEQFATASAFEAFRYSCFQAVEMEERRITTTTRRAPDHQQQQQQITDGLLPDHIVRSTWFFLPDVWKVQPMLKKKRKATRSAPAQAFPFCFRVFVYIREPVATSSSGGSNGGDTDESTAQLGGYRCLASMASSFFELYSTRTVDRVKRKFCGSDGDENGAAVSTVLATTPSSTHVAKRISRP